nr:hypothetical protein [Lachnospiraceae bacterium]
MTARGKTLKILIPVLEVLIIASLLTAFVYVFINARGEGDVFDISEGWDVIVDDKEYENVDLSTFTFPRDVKNVHEINMYYHLSDDMLHGMTMRVYTRL